MFASGLLVQLLILFSCIFLGLFVVCFPHQTVRDRLRGFSKLDDGCYYVRSRRGFKRAFLSYVRGQPTRRSTLTYGATLLEYPCEVSFESWDRESERVVLVYETPSGAGKLSSPINQPN